MSLMNEIEKTINKTINDFMVNINTEFPNISITELERIWSNLNSTPTKTPRVPTHNTSVGCIYIFTKGANNGNPCNVKICSESQSYCVKHKKNDNQPIKEKKSAIPVPD